MADTSDVTREPVDQINMLRIERQMEKKFILVHLNGDKILNALECNVILQIFSLYVIPPETSGILQETQTAPESRDLPSSERLLHKSDMLSTRAFL